jgi:uncharacterized RDD family membrane protein YckC/predicted RNA-binding Zn-ribbon protein involved in translation (DUF1610 family)
LAGKKAKCPGCGATVEVPAAQEEILEAELAEPAPAAPSNLGSLLDETDAYELEHPQAAAQPTEESRRPCPACGEMIIATAAKCRFCGEVLDRTLRGIEGRTGRGRSGGGGGRPLASRSARLGAAILDGLIGMVLVFPGFVMIMAQRGPGAKAGVALGVVLMLGGILVLLVIQIVLLSTQGQTMGKKAVGVRIQKMEDGSNPGFVGAVFLRGIVPGLIGAIPYLGALFGLVDIFCIFGEERRCIHDQIAGTIVVEA